MLVYISMHRYKLADGPARPQDTITGLLLAGTGHVDPRGKKNFLVVDSSEWLLSPGCYSAADEWRVRGASVLQADVALTALQRRQYPPSSRHSQSTQNDKILLSSSSIST